MTILIICVLVFILRSRQYVAAEGRELHVRGLTRTKVFRREALSKVVELDIRTSGGGREQVRPAWLVIDHSGAVVVKLNRRAWNAGELDAVRRDLGLIREAIPGEQDPHTVNDSFPGTLSWWTVHPNKSGVLVVATIIAFALLINLVGR